LFVRKPIKLIDCEIRDPASTELFLVEGDSAAGAVASVRSVQSQAVLPMQGKPMNAWKATAPKVADNELFAQLSRAVGQPIVDANPTQTKLFSMNLTQLGSLRYSKLLLLFDPDADGIHCGALMLMFLYRWMRPLIEAGQVEMIRAPLFEITCRPDEHGTVQTGYAYSVEHKNALCEALAKRAAIQIKAHHYRGLGSIDPAVLSATCISRETRKTQVMTIADALAAIEVFSPNG
jgi:DNA gyrase subunit B